MSRDSWRYRGKTICRILSSSGSDGYVILEYAALGRAFSKRSLAKKAIDEVLDAYDLRRGERGPDKIGAEILYRTKTIVRVEDSRRGRKRYRIQGVHEEMKSFASVDAAIATIDRIRNAYEAIGEEPQWDALPMNSNK